MFQPSIRMKNKILNGREMTVGGSIIIPMDIVSVATIMSMTRNGKVIRKPISKPRLSSEIMKAGMSIRVSISASAPWGGGLTPASSSNSRRSF